MAETPKHTPGPWKAAGGALVQASIESETLKSGRRVARRVAVAKGLTIEEVAANARLIAAAPDLLAALELSRELDRATCPTAEFQNRVREVVNAAIAKATGA